VTELPLLTNVAAYSAQVLCLAALGGLLSAVIRINTPAVRYAYWRALVAVCIALPWLQGRQVPAIDTSVIRESVFLLAPGTGAIEQDGARGPAAPSPATMPFSLPSWPAIALVMLAGGAGARLLWLTVGLARLRRLRHAGQLAELSDSDETLRAAIAPRASIREVDGLRQPVTFGLFKPVILIPASLRTCDAEIRRAVLCHELHHARRRDWVSVLIEELALCALWFHPAAWWLISRVQLSREEVVDELVVRTTGTRRTYIEALMLFAGEPGLAPAPAFSRRQHLFHRIILLSKETHMSMPRLLSSLCVWAAAIGAGIWSGAGLFPLSAAAGPELPAVHRVTKTSAPVPGVAAQPRVDLPATRTAARLEQAGTPATAAPTASATPRQTVRVPVLTPPEMTAVNATGVVLIRLAIDPAGHVVNPRVAGYAISRAEPAKYQAVQQEPLPSTNTVFPGEPDWQAAADAMNRAALAAARQFRYEPPATPMAVVYAAVMVPSPDGFVLLSPNRIGLPTSDPSALAATGGPGIGAVTGATSPAPFTVDSDLRRRAQDTTEAARRGRAAANQAQGGAPGPSAAGIAAGTSSPTAAAPPLPVPAPASQLPGQRAPVRVGGNIPPPKKVKDVKPVYPAIAQSARVQGIVIIETTISETGKVVDARVLRSIPLLDGAALAAVMQWEFTPTLLNGEPTAIIMSVTVNFTLDSLPPSTAPPAPQ
jgi:protein TonB